MELADASYHWPGPGQPEEVVGIALREQVSWVISASIPEPLNVRDAIVKEILESEYRIPVAAQPRSVVTVAADKHATRQFCLRHGFPVAPGMLAASAADVLAALDALGGFPLVCKAPTGWGGAGLAVVTDRDQLHDHFAAGEGQSFLVEAFMEGIEYSVETFSHAGDVLVMPPTCKSATSITGLHAMEHLRFAPSRVDGLQEFAAQVVHALGAAGPAELDIVVTARGPVLLEINPRFSGTTQFSFATSGVNPYRLLADAVRGIWSPLEVSQDPMMALQIPVRVDEQAWPDWKNDMVAVPGVQRVIRQPLRSFTGRVMVVGRDPGSLQQTIALLGRFPGLEFDDRELPGAIAHAAESLPTARARLIHKSLR